MNNVLITIRGKQKYCDRDDWDTTEFITEGVFEEFPGGCRVSYDESGEIGAENVKSVLTVTDGTRAEITRTGKVSSQMIVEKGKRNNCLYSTPEGDFLLGIYGKDVKIEIKERKSEIYLCYTLDVNANPISENKMEIKIKEINA